jgi:hypothetical protein
MLYECASKDRKKVFLINYFRDIGNIPKDYLTQTSNVLPKPESKPETLTEFNLVYFV